MKHTRMKSMNEHFKYCLLFIALTSSQMAQAGPWSWAKRVGRAIVGKVPVVGDAVNEARLEEKVDHIKTKQKTGLDKLQELAKKSTKTKEKVEEIYYFKEQSRRRAEELVKGLKRGSRKNLLGALVERWIGIPINPADYVPNTAYTRELKKNLEWDLSSERGLIQQHGYFLQATRTALLEQPDLFDKRPEQFNQAYERALRYEQELAKALSAKKQATIQLYRADIANLEKEITVLEQTKKKKGLTVADVMQLEIAVDNKRHIIRGLNEKITDGIAEGMQLSDEQQAILYQQKAQKDTEALTDFLNEERKRIRAQYSYLWTFW